jgi:hypothetical protein
MPDQPSPKSWWHRLRLSVRALMFVVLGHLKGKSHSVRVKFWVSA